MELLRKRFALDLQTFAIITLVLGNLAQAFSDVLVKLIGPGFSPFQYMFLRQLLTLLVLLPFMLRVPRAAWGLGAWKWHLLRGHLCLLGGGGMMLALTQLPLATANAIFYVSPLLTLPLPGCSRRRSTPGSGCWGAWGCLVSCSCSSQGIFIWRVWVPW